MANLKASKKDILRNARNRMRNMSYKSRMKTVIKKAQIAIESKADDREQIARNALCVIDKTISAGVIHKKNGSRRKSQLARALNKSAA